MSKPPSQPGSDAWHFVEELKKPLIPRVRWQRKKPTNGEADLSKGVCLDWDFPDSNGLLQTAREDFGRFARKAGLSLRGDYPVRFRQGKMGKPESFRLKIADRRCDIIAGDTEGMRRAIYCLEEQLLASDGPFLRTGEIRRRPVVETRISRCFFGPIKQPPKNRDELADDENYYPEEYLSRLAREGVNGLWLTAGFHELCPSRFFPDFGRDAHRRLQKLHETIRRCARYGIGIYVFCIEPRGFGDNPEYLHSVSHLKRLPELGGHQDGAFTFFCTSTATGREYLEEATEFLFSQVPELAGLITITLGERPTHCYSNMLWDSGANNCPRCSKRKPWQVFRDTLGAMRRGMKKGNPRAKLIAWLYVPSVSERPDRTLRVFYEEVAEIAAKFPCDVVLQYNFESMGEMVQLGRTRRVRDYSLAYIGPSQIFTTCARQAVAHGVAVSAKLQVGCSHEVATLPCVPVPGNLFRKYRAMHRLGVSAAMQCWYFGNYPSLMTQAAGRLSFAPLPRTEHEFLLELARPRWGIHAPRMAEAWEHFGAAYREFPTNLNFAWFGPVHNCVAWPLHLKPVNQGIAPSWLLNFPPSGDRVGECIGFGHTLEEICILCDRMAARWSQGMACLNRIPLAIRREGKEEIGLAEAMGIQLRSASNVMRFYALRETLFHTAAEENQKRLGLWRSLKKLTRDEMFHSQRLAKLCRNDSRLGFHSEAEGYKYFPELLDWRVRELQKILTEDFPKVEMHIRAGRALFPQYTGAVSRGAKVYPGNWEECLPEKIISPAWRTRFRVERERAHLVMDVKCGVPSSIARRQKPATPFVTDYVAVLLEPRRLGPTREFCVGISGERFDALGREPGQPFWESQVEATRWGWRVSLKIPWILLGEVTQKIRLNVIRTSSEAGVLSWIGRHPLPTRLLFGDRNPSDLGWLESNTPATRRSKA